MASELKQRRPPSVSPPSASASVHPLAPGKIARKNEELRLPGNHHCVKNKEGANRVSYKSGAAKSVQISQDDHGQLLLQEFAQQPKTLSVAVGA